MPIHSVKKQKKKVFQYSLGFSSDSFTVMAVMSICVDCGLLYSDLNPSCPFCRISSLVGGSTPINKPP